ncbi:MAG: hypothetical protein AAFX99_19080 [Myxococcota bacterium]
MKPPKPQRARRTVKVVRPFFASGRTIRPGEVVSLTEETAAAKVRSYKAVYVDDKTAKPKTKPKKARRRQAPKAQTANTSAPTQKTETK